MGIHGWPQEAAHRSLCSHGTTACDRCSGRMAAVEQLGHCDCTFCLWIWLPIRMGHHSLVLSCRDFHHAREGVCIVSVNCLQLRPEHCYHPCYTHTVEITLCDLLHLWGAQHHQRGLCARMCEGNKG